jgi:hypothetical protein
MAYSRNGVEPIAIIGLSFKFAGGAVDYKFFWEMLTEGRVIDLIEIDLNLKFGQVEQIALKSSCLLLHR